MNLLAIDTSTEQCIVALCRDRDIIESTLAIPKQHTEHILPMIDNLLLQANISLSALDAIAICTGPGSFVGIRVGVSVVQALGFVHNTPVIPLSSLAVIAQCAYRLAKSEAVAVLEDARMNQVYAGFYRANSSGIMQPVCPDVVTTMAALEMPSTEQWTRAGKIWESYPEQLEVLVANPAGIDLFLQAQWQFNNQRTMSVMELEPVYLQGNNLWQKKAQA